MSSPSEVLADASSLTEIQVETIELQQAIRKREISVKNALASRKNHAVRPGTHYRILGQARSNVKQSVFTVIIAVQLGILDPAELNRLLGTISKLSPNLNQAALENVVEITKALVDRIVML